MLVLLSGPASYAQSEPLPESSYVDTHYSLTDLSHSAEQGDVRAAYLLGTRYSSGRGGIRDDSQAIRWFKRAAEGELPEAQFNLGVMYAAGRGVSRDVSAAAGWFKLAADQGLAEAQHAIGTLHLTGRGVNQDVKVAIYWLRQAADQHYAAAEFNLGVLHEYGRGVPRSLSKARKWYERAEENGFESATVRLASLDKRIADAKAGRKSEDKQASEASPSANKTNTASQVDGRAALEGLDSERFVLQLVSYRTLDRAQAAIKRFRLRDSARIIERVVKSKRYFVILYGDFADEASARKAISKLPVKLKRAKPFPRKVSSIRAQLEG